MQIYKTNFMGFIVRVVQRHGLEPVFPIIDVANAIGYSKQAMRQICINNADILEGEMDKLKLSIAVTQKHSSGAIYNRKRDKEHLCLTQDGLNGVLFKLTPSRLKDEEKRKIIIRFQKWMMKNATQVQRGKIPPAFVIEEIADLLQFKGGRKRGAAVRMLAKARGVTKSTIYKKLQVCNGGLLIIGNFSKPPKYPDEIPQILDYKKAHPKAGGTEMKSVLNLTYSANRINAILLESKN